MTILPQSFTGSYSDLFTSTEKQTLMELISPLNQTPSLWNYLTLVETLDKSSRRLVLKIMKDAIERMDLEYRISMGRRVLYHVKQTRSRTLITVFGDLTYVRTEYIDKYTKKSYCHVDRKLGLRKKERYDPCVQALIIEEYANSNSMIKVGIQVGDRISGNFNISSGKWSVPRQTVYNILKRFGKIEVQRLPKETTPEKLHVMADEKFIPLQREGKKKAKLMVKVAVIFEEIEAITKKDGSPTKRNQILNKTLVIGSGSGFWDKVSEVLYQLYDMDKVKTVYLMGDGANWLFNGMGELKPQNGRVAFGIDRFHFRRAINRISTDSTMRKILTDYARNNMKKEFIILANSIKDSSTERSDSIQENISYTIKHWHQYQMMNKEIVIGCPMEQVISHVIASNFTSVPKAYSRNRLPSYLNYRELFHNCPDLRNTILTAMSLQKNDEKNIIIPAEEFDFSFFEKKNYNIPELRLFNKNIITKF